MHDHGHAIEREYRFLLRRFQCAQHPAALELCGIHRSRRHRQVRLACQQVDKAGARSVGADLHIELAIGTGPAHQQLVVRRREAFDSRVAALLEPGFGQRRR